jgi:GntR family transcriptional regulator
MVQFFVDKANKVPLYLQLTDEIKYFISTGILGDGEQLPPVKMLARSLGINFLTVRKAYKEVENAGLLIVKHGEGTFISLTNCAPQRHGKPNGRASAANRKPRFADAFKALVEKYAGEGLDVSEGRKIVDEVFGAIERSRVTPVIIFAECNQFQIDEISVIIAEELKLEVKPILVENLKKTISPWIEEGREVNIVTTGFHVEQVRNAVADLPVRIDVLITNLHPQTRRQLEAVGENGKYGFICRDRESAAIYKDLLKSELGYKQINLRASTLAETDKVKDILDSSDVILVSPQVYESVIKFSPPRKPIFNVFDRVDPMSLKVVCDRIRGDMAGR